MNPSAQTEAVTPEVLILPLKGETQAILLDFKSIEWNYLLPHLIPDIPKSVMGVVHRTLTFHENRVDLTLSPVPGSDMGKRITFPIDTFITELLIYSKWEIVKACGFEE